jgi:hypothetical protein
MTPLALTVVPARRGLCAWQLLVCEGERGPRASQMKDRVRTGSGKPSSGPMLFGGWAWARCHIAAGSFLACSSDPRRQATGQGFIQGREQVAVGSEGHLDRGMPQALHDRPWVCTFGYEQAGVSVTQVVIAQAIGQSSPAYRGLEMAPVPERMAHEPTSFGREQQRTRLQAGSTGQVVEQVGYQDLGYRHGPRSSCLGRTHRQLPSYV